MSLRSQIRGFCEGIKMQRFSPICINDVQAKKSFRAKRRISVKQIYSFFCKVSKSNGNGYREEEVNCCGKVYTK